MAQVEQERRRYERILLPLAADLYAADARGNRLGRVQVLGRGGCFVVTGQRFDPGSELELMLVDDMDVMRRDVRAVARSVMGNGVGFEFRGLPPDVAVEIGVILGRYRAVEAAR